MELELELEFFDDDEEITKSSANKKDIDKNSGKTKSKEDQKTPDNKE